MKVTEPSPIATRSAFLLGAAAVLLAILVGSCSINPQTLPVTAVPLLGKPQYIFINELFYDKELDRVIVPGGDTGKLFLINPDDPEHVEKPIDVASPGGSGGGVVSAAGAVIGQRSYIFVADRNGPTLHVIDPDSGTNLISHPLKGKPEYVRFIHNPNTGNEIWVTEPEQEQIEIFVFKDEDAPSLEALTQTAPNSNEGIVPIPVPGGPTGLIYDERNSRVYTNQPNLGNTSVYHALSHKQLDGAWANGCTDARGLALSEDGQYLFIACEEGKLVVIDVNSGVQVMSAIFGKGLNQVSYSSEKECIYLPSGGSRIMGVFRMAPPTPVPTPTRSFLDKVLPAPATPASIPSSPRLKPGGATATPENPAATSPEKLVLQLFSSADTASNADCVTTDKNGNVWVCDPQNGRVLRVESCNNQ